MPSIRSRIAREFVRLNVTLSGFNHYPYRLQRLVFSRAIPLISLKVPGVACEPLTVSGVPAAWFVPDNAVSGRSVLFIHGGGYVLGSINSYRKLTSRIAAAAHCRVLVIDYRLAPEHACPAAVEDAVTSYKWLLSQGYGPGKMIIAGDSAGGGIVTAALVSLRDSGEPLPAGAMLLSPWADLGVTGGSVKSVAWKDPLISPRSLRRWAAMYLGAAGCEDPVASPIYADLKGLPPLYIQTGTVEVLKDDAGRLAEKAREDGVAVELDVWEGMFHGWHFSAPLVPESSAAIERLGRFVRDRTNVED